MTSSVLLLDTQVAANSRL